MAITFKLTQDEAAYNVVKWNEHQNNQTKEYGFGVFKWGHKFIRLEKNSKILYKVLFTVFSKIGLIKTEANDKAYILDLKAKSFTAHEPAIAPIVDQKVTAATTPLWGTINDQSNNIRSLLADKTDFQKKNQQDLDQANLEKLKLQSNLNQLQGAVGKLQSDNSSKEAVINDLNSQVDSLKKNLPAINEKDDQIKLLNVQIQDLKREILNANTKLIAAQTDSKTRSETQEALNKQIIDLKAALELSQKAREEVLKKVDDDVKKVKKELKKANKEKETLEADLQTEKVLSNALKNKLDTVEQKQFEADDKKAEHEEDKKIKKGRSLHFPSFRKEKSKKDFEGEPKAEKPADAKAEAPVKAVEAPADTKADTLAKPAEAPEEPKVENKA